VVEAGDLRDIPVLWPGFSNAVCPRITSYLDDVRRGLRGELPVCEGRGVGV
jgi:hypothetical protein